MAEIEFYQNQIKRLMFVDTFQAFADITKQMTVPEVMERVSEKMTMLGPAVGRYMDDVLQPLIEKVVMILWEQNRLPRIPDAMLEDPSFEVKFVGRLVQTQRQSEMNNLVNAISIAGQVAQIKPEILDKINGDKVIDEIFDINSISAKIINSDEEVQQLRQQRAQMQQQQAEMMMYQQGADIYNKVAQGDKNAKEAVAEEQ